MKLIPHRARMLISTQAIFAWDSGNNLLIGASTGTVQAPDSYWCAKQYMPPCLYGHAKCDLPLG